MDLKKVRRRVCESLLRMGYTTEQVKTIALKHLVKLDEGLWDKATKYGSTLIKGNSKFVPKKLAEIPTNATKKIVKQLGKSNEKIKAANLSGQASHGERLASEEGKKAMEHRAWLKRNRKTIGIGAAVGGGATYLHQKNKAPKV